MSPHGWRERAACSGQPAHIWFPPGADAEEHATEAKQVCGGCPVSADCLEQALADREQHGIWGGLTTDERNDLLAARDRGRSEG